MGGKGGQDFVGELTSEGRGGGGRGVIRFFGNFGGWYGGGVCVAAETRLGELETHVILCVGNYVFWGGGEDAKKVSVAWAGNVRERGVDTSLVWG